MNREKDLVIMAAGVLEKRFVTFLAEGGLENPKSEFLIPTEVGGMLFDA